MYTENIREFMKPFFLISITITIFSFAAGGSIGYLDALVHLDEYHQAHTKLIQNELFSLDNKIANIKYQLRLNGSALVSSNSSRLLPETNKIVFCSAEENPEIPVSKASTDLKNELSQLKKDEKKVWEFSEIHDSMPAMSENNSNSSPLEWSEKVVGKASEIRQKRREEDHLRKFWSTYDVKIPASIKVFITSYEDEKPPINPLHAPQISAALSLMPPGFSDRLNAIYIVYGEETMRRGGSGLGVVFIKGEESNIFPTLIHEFGHIYDFSFESKKGTPSSFHNGITQLTEDDPSVEFYEMSWENNQEHRGDQRDFCSCYGTNNPQEDFAEAFAMYVLQGSTFEGWSKKNPVLKQKYTFLKNIFQGKTFSSSTIIDGYPFSIIDLSVDYEELLKPSPYRST